jgi:hypothetical protein
MVLSPRISLPRGARYEAPAKVRRTTILYEDGTEIVITSDDGGEHLFTNRPMEQREDGIWRVRR